MFSPWFWNQVLQGLLFNPWDDDDDDDDADDDDDDDDECCYDSMVIMRFLRHNKNRPTSHWQFLVPIICASQKPMPFFNTLPETNMFVLKMDDWKMIHFLLGLTAIFSGANWLLLFLPSWFSGKVENYPWNETETFILEISPSHFPSWTHEFLEDAYIFSP